MFRFRPHKIRTQTVDVEFENPKDVFEFNNHLSTVCKQMLVPAIEKLLDDKVEKNRIISIDKLYIDTGILDKENWENKLVESVIDKLGRYLDEIIIENQFREENNYQDTYEGLSIGSSSPVSGKGIEIREAEREAECIQYFLKRGVLPWFAEIKNKDEFKSLLVKLINSADPFKQEIRKLILSDETAFERLVYHTTEDDILSFLTTDNSRISEIRELWKSWGKIFDRLSVPNPQRKLIFFKAVRKLIQSSGSLSEDMSWLEALSEKIVQFLNKEQIETLMKMADHPGNYNRTPSENRLLKFLSKNKENWKREISNLKKLKQREKVTTSDHKTESAFNEENPVYIINAGLVLLHPFLKNLFENVGYTEQNLWISEETHQRALVLSQYLIGGNEDYPEYELLLNKILTGYSPEETLFPEIELSAFEKKEADDLLQAVIGHWTALKNTSIQVLQATFLQREGKLVKKESGWLLQVEQKAFDVLVEKIPWGFSTIKTPWMKEILSVEWA